MLGLTSDALTARQPGYWTTWSRLMRVTSLAFAGSSMSFCYLTGDKPHPLCGDFTSLEITKSDLESSLVRCWAILLLPESD